MKGLSRFPFAVADILIICDARVVPSRFMFAVAEINILRYAKVVCTRFPFAVADKLILVEFFLLDFDISVCSCRYLDISWYARVIPYTYFVR